MRQMLKVRINGTIWFAIFTFACSSGIDDTMLRNWEHSDGTSMATPPVSAIAALVFQSHPTWRDEQIEDRLKTTAVNLGPAGYDTTFGYGLVNAEGATAP